MTGYSSSAIYRQAPADPMTEAEKDERAREAWRAGSDMVALRLSEVKCDIHRQAIVNEATRQHGARPKRRG